MTDPAEVDVLVAGAGPTGLTLAAELQAFGTRFRIVDRHPDRAHESRAVAVQARSLEVLSALGVGATMAAEGNPAVRLAAHVGSRVSTIELFDLGMADTAYPYILFLSQAETERILTERLGAGGATVERGTELVGFRSDGSGVLATLRHADGRTEQVRARHLAGCDGMHSAVREAAGIGFAGMTYPQSFLLADVEVDGIEPGRVHMFMTRYGMLFFFPLGGPATWRLLTVRPPDDDGDTGEPSLADVQAVVDAHVGRGIRLRDPAWLAIFRLHSRRAAAYRSGPALLAGDAAHVHSPAGGQGMNVGIQDAANLGWKLALVAAGVADPALVDTYATEREPVGREVVRFTDRAFRVATSTNPVVRLLRSQLLPRALPVALRPRAVRRRVFRTISELGVTYRGGPLAVDGTAPAKRGPRAGDRLPDAPVRRDGATTTLQAAVAGPAFTLLLCGPGFADAALAGLRPGRFLRVLRLDRGSGDLRDPDGTALGRLRVAGPTQLLVRPDGHLAYRADGTDLTGLATVLDRWLPGR